MSEEQQTPNPASITFLTGPLAGKTIHMSKPTIMIGRNLKNDVVIKDDLEVSRQHACLRWQDGVWTIENVSEGNTLTVNDKRVQQVTSLDDQAIVSLGGVTTFQVSILPAASAQFDQTLPASAPRSKGRRKETTEPTVRLTAPKGQPKATPPHETLAEIGPPTPALVSSTLPAISVGAFAPPVTASEEAEPTALLGRASQTLVGVATLLHTPTLEVSSNTGEPRRSYPLDKAVVNIGRAASNEIVIGDQTVSAQHLQVVREGQQFVLLHPAPARESTTNGLLYHGQKIRGDETYRKALVNGDVFRIGDESGALITLTYRDGSGAALEPVTPIQPIALGADELTIGRKAENTVVLAHPLVSAHHARLVREGGTYRLHDLHSTNHVYVNGQQITSQLLKLGDEIRVGPYRLIYESTHITQFDESHSIRIDGLHLKKYGAKHALLLNDISLSIPPRAFVALVGGSGAGKSTLMDALSGLRPAEEGQVLYNGQDYYRNLAAFNTQIGYVPQEDIVHRDLTVERALYYAAKIRLPGDFTEELIWQRIGEVLEDVELTERRQALIKRLSGGQRKRVSIALELLANPSLFFLDEPTSGLDPGLDRKMMVLLRKLADKGHTIILVTHATNNINVCDYVCFLASGGRLAYFGPPDGAKTYFEKVEFAEIYSALDPSEERPNAPEEAEARFKASSEYQQYIGQPLEKAASPSVQPIPLKEIRRGKRGSHWQQFALLSRRRLELLRNDVPTLLILALQAPLLGILLMVLIRFGLGSDLLQGNSIVRCQPQLRTTSGQVLVIPAASTQSNTITCDHVLAYLQTDPTGEAYAQARGGAQQALQDFEVAGHSGDSQRLVFMLGLIPMIFGCITGSREIIKEVAIYKRERAVSLGILPYMLSKMVVLSVLSLLQMACLVLIVNWFVPLSQGVFLPVLLETYITLALGGIAGVLLGFVASAWAPNDDTAANLLTVVLVPQVIFSGLIVPLKVPVVQIIAMIFPLRWIMAALGTSLGLHSDLVGGDRLLGSGDNYLYHPMLYSVYTKDEATQRILLSWLALVVLIVLMVGCVGLALKRKDARG